jgi:uncharacterized protein
MDLPTGGATTLRATVPVEDIEFGGQRYAVRPAAPEARVDVARALTGRHLRLRSRAEVVGPCWRCLAEARVRIGVDTTEFAAEGRPADAPFDDDLDSPYLSEDSLDLALWLRDSLVEGLPATILCREDCAGLCPVCGAELAEGPCGCSTESRDPRWSPLEELAERLRRQQGG